METWEIISIALGSSVAALAVIMLAVFLCKKHKYDVKERLQKRQEFEMERREAETTLQQLKLAKIRSAGRLLQQSPPAHQNKVSIPEDTYSYCTVCFPPNGGVTPPYGVTYPCSHISPQRGEPPPNVSYITAPSQPALTASQNVTVPPYGTPQYANSTTQCATSAGSATTSYYATPPLGTTSPQYSTPPLGAALPQYSTPSLSAAFQQYSTPPLAAALPQYSTPPLGAATSQYTTPLPGAIAAQYGKRRVLDASNVTYSPPIAASSSAIAESYNRIRFPRDGTEIPKELPPIAPPGFVTVPMVIDRYA